MIECVPESIADLLNGLDARARDADDTEHHRRLIRARIGNERATTKLFEVIGPRFDGQGGGYTRIYKLGQRKGDGAPLALIEFVE